MSDILLESRNGTVANLTLNRPQARNALSLELLQVLESAILRLGADAGVHVITIAAEGPAFCAGHDLKEITKGREASDKGRAFFEETMAACASMMQAVVNCPKPVIASVHATATAAGCQLVASCDLAIASTEARFATPGVNIGLFCSTPMVALSRNVSRKHAMEMLLTGDLIGAEQAQAFGLVNKVVSPEALADATQELAQKIASKAPRVLKIGKEAFYAQAEMPLSQAYDYAAHVMVENLLAEDAKEGIGAFVEKRTPNWQPPE